VQFVDKRKTELIFHKKRVFYCKNEHQNDCLIDEINDVYPGQTVQFYLINTIGITIRATVNTVPPTSCRGIKVSEMEQYVFNNCTRVKYTINHNKRWCELFLSITDLNQSENTSHKTSISTLQMVVDVFYIKQLHCPFGFTLNKLEGFCQCDHQPSHFLSPAATLMIKQYYVHLTVGYLLKCITALIYIKYPYNVHMIIVYSTHHILTFPILTLNVIITGLVCCVEDVKKVSVVCLVHLSVNIVLMILFT